MSAVALGEARDESRFGGKAVSLGAALRAGLAVPPGVAMAHDLVDEVAEAREEAEALCAEVFEMLAASLAVRSSAVGEDSSSASFAGQHLTRLNVSSYPDMLEAVRAVWASGRSAAALAYRRRLGLDAAPRVGVVVQALVVPTVAGVLFTRHPVTGADERVIEASWGLGEAVVSGLVSPDRFRLARGGRLLESELGDKDVEIIAEASGGTREREVEPERRESYCLKNDELAALDDLASRCEAFFEGPSDIEFAFEGTRLFLLQRRAVTR